MFAYKYESDFFGRFKIISSDLCVVVLVFFQSGLIIFEFKNGVYKIGFKILENL